MAIDGRQIRTVRWSIPGPVRSGAGAVSSGQPGRFALGRSGGQWLEIRVSGCSFASRSSRRFRSRSRRGTSAGRSRIPAASCFRASPSRRGRTSLPTPRVTVTGGAGDYRLPALPPGNYTLTFDLSGMDKVTKQVMVQLAQDTVRGRGDERGGRQRDRDGHGGDHARHREGLHRPQELGLDRGRSSRCRSARSTADLIKLIPGVQYTQDTTRGPSAGGSGQDNVVQVRRRQRDAAAVRHAVGRARVARHRPGDHDQGRRQGRGFRPRRRVLGRLGQQVGHVPVLGHVELPAPEQRDGRGAHERQRLALRPGSNLADGQPRRPGHQEQGVLLRVVLPADPDPRTTPRTCTAAARLREHPQRGVRQADGHADQLRSS